MRVDPLAARPAAVGRDAGAAPRRWRAAHRDRLRLHALDRPAVRPGDAGTAAGVRRAAAERSGRRVGPGQHRLRARRRGAAVEPVVEPDRHAPARARADRGAACPPRHRPGDRSRLDRRAPRSRSWRRRWRRCTRTRPAAGPSPRSPATSPPPARRSTTASGRCSASRRSATSRRGACTSPPTCWRPPSCRCSPSPGASATTSEEAFSRAFKRERGAPPSHWRRRLPARG